MGNYYQLIIIIMILIIIKFRVRAGPGFMIESAILQGTLKQASRQLNICKVNFI